VNELEKLFETLCPTCAATVRSIAAAVIAAGVKEMELRHEANKAAAEAAVKTSADAERILKGGTT
jgi:hypothetical protein